MSLPLHVEGCHGHFLVLRHILVREEIVEAIQPFDRFFSIKLGKFQSILFLHLCSTFRILVVAYRMGRVMTTIRATWRGLPHGLNRFEHLGNSFLDLVDVGLYVIIDVVLKCFYSFFLRHLGSNTR